MSENLDINDQNETGTGTLDTVKETKVQILGKYMLTTLKEMYESLRYPKFKFAISGIIATVVLALLGLAFFIGPYFFEEGNGITLVSIRIPPNPIGVIISIIIACIMIYLWFLIGIKITPKAAHYLVDNKILKFVFTKGNVHYLEYISVEKRKIASPHILNKFIALLVAWVSVSAFLLNLTALVIADGNPDRILNPSGDLEILAFLLRSIIIFVFVPLLFTLIYPLGWMLVDAKLKAYNSKAKLNWLVGQKVVNLTAGFITIMSLFALGADMAAADELLPRAQLILDLVLFCVVNISLTVILISLFYNVFFQGKIHQMIIDSIEVSHGITSVTLTDEFGNPLPEPEPEPQPEPEPELKFEEEE